MRLFATALAATLAVAAAGQAQADLISNGDFELFGDGWTTTGTVGFITLSDYMGIAGSPASLANRAASFGPGDLAGEHVLTQSFATVVGDLYILSFDLGAFGGASNIMQVSVGDAVAGYSAIAVNNAETTFHAYTLGFTGTGMDTVRFSVTTVADSTDALVDNVSVLAVSQTNPVPEPGAWALMILGFGAVGANLRRRGLAVHEGSPR